MMCLWVFAVINFRERQSNDTDNDRQLSFSAITLKAEDIMGIQSIV